MAAAGEDGEGVGDAEAPRRVETAERVFDENHGLGLDGGAGDAGDDGFPGLGGSRPEDGGGAPRAGDAAADAIRG